MISENEVIEKIRECKTKEQLFAVFEETSNNEMKFWDESIYKTARGHGHGAGHRLRRRKRHRFKQLRAFQGGRFHQKDTLKRFFERFEQNKLIINRFRADCGSMFRLVFWMRFTFSMSSTLSLMATACS